jgi:putative membrane protein insertion efficiency factor
MTTLTFERWPRQALMALIALYQNTLGPAMPPSCRYQPTCSHYAYAAVARHGALRGSWLALKRLLRCAPWGGSGYDPVP